MHTYTLVLHVEKASVTLRRTASSDKVCPDAVTPSLTQKTLRQVKAGLAGAVRTVDLLGWG